MQPYSRRNQPPPDHLRYDLPDDVRHRIFHTLLHEVGTAGEIGHKEFCRDLRQLILRKTGQLFAPAYDAVRTTDDPACEHFFSAGVDGALDWIEFVFVVGHGLTDESVKEVNDIFREDGIGYELTPFVFKEDAKRVKTRGRVYVEVEALPQIIKKADQFTHEQVVKPAIHLLTDPRFHKASEEFHLALQAHRQDNKRNAIAECGAALETTIKTICHLKGWTYDPKATLDPLLKTLQANGLLFDFYPGILIGTATVRNRMGGHGQGPAPVHVPEMEHVEHLLAMTAAHIVMLVKLAKV
jgi:hypothetical protein